MPTIAADVPRIPKSYVLGCLATRTAPLCRASVRQQESLPRFLMNFRTLWESGNRYISSHPLPLERGRVRARHWSIWCSIGHFRHLLNQNRNAMVRGFRFPNPRFSFICAARRVSHALASRASLRREENKNKMQSVIEPEDPCIWTNWKVCGLYALNLSRKGGKLRGRGGGLHI